jgi:hypothetical protein
MTNAFTVKQLQGSITINPSSSTPTFQGSNSNTITFGGPGNSAVRMSANIHNAGGKDGTLDLTVWGLPLSVMKQLSTYGQQINLLPKNQIILQAGDDSGLSQAFQGSILTSIIDPHQPEVSMKMTANVAAAFSAVAGTPASYNGKVSVATAMQSIATQMGLSFENNGVTTQLSNTYLYGSPRDQYNTIREHADISATIDRGVLAIWPRFQNRSGGAVTISALDGSMIGYPSFTATGVMVQALYNSSFAIGKQIIINDSQIVPQGSTWNAYMVNHALESQVYGGKWESTLMVTSPNFQTALK